MASDCVTFGAAQVTPRQPNSIHCGNGQTSNGEHSDNIAGIETDERDVNNHSGTSDGDAGCEADCEDYRFDSQAAMVKKLQNRLDVIR